MPPIASTPEPPWYTDYKLRIAKVGRDYGKATHEH